MEEMDKVMTWVEGAREEITAFVTTYGLSVIGGLIILVVGWIVAG